MVTPVSGLQENLTRAQSLNQNKNASMAADFTAANKQVFASDKITVNGNTVSVDDFTLNRVVRVNLHEYPILNGPGNQQGFLTRNTELGTSPTFVPVTGNSDAWEKISDIQNNPPINTSLIEHNSLAWRDITNTSDSL
jgi:hypothetical protein